MASTQSLLLYRSPDLLRAKRWAGVLLASILLHVVALHWAELVTQPHALHNRNIINAALHPAPIQNSVTALTDGGSASMIKSLPAPNPNNAYAINTTSKQTVLAANPPVAAAITSLMNDNKIISTPTESRNTMHYSINLPPSAELRYDVIASKKGVLFHGQSTINWQSDGTQYRINGSSDIDAMGTRSFQSEGTIDQFGIAPLLYTEKASNKSATNTHFQRERNLISFSSSTASYPRQGGEQDRASIIWQLTGIGRGSPEKFLTGTDFDIFVAGVRDGDVWRIHVIDDEEIDISTGKTSAWHLVHMPRPGTYEQRLDIWLAPLQSWHPVKLRYTQVNGDALEMSLINVSSVVTH